MTEYIDRTAAIVRACKCVKDDYEAFDVKEALKAIPAVAVVHCRDCMYWRDEYIKQNDGRERQYTDADVDALGIRNSVTNEVGINMGAMCRREDNRGWAVDKSLFRNADDFCSRGELRPCCYEQWWGIVDGYYPEVTPNEQS